MGESEQKFGQKIFNQFELKVIIRFSFANQSKILKNWKLFTELIIIVYYKLTEIPKDRKPNCNLKRKRVVLLNSSNHEQGDSIHHQKFMFIALIFAVSGFAFS